jgi:ubiquitin-like protein ATG12
LIPIIVEILLKAAGNAPIMKKKKWAVGYDKTIGWVIDFIKRYLKLEASQALVRYTFLQ